MNYSFHPHAERELKEVENYYESIREELGDRFRAEIELTISRIIRFPEAWPTLSLTIRRGRLNTFPYGIVYKVMSDEILLVAVMHLHREPHYWADRV